MRTRPPRIEWPFRVAVVVGAFMIALSFMHSGWSGPSGRPDPQGLGLGLVLLLGGLWELTRRRHDKRRSR
ncbi:MAG: hypothetical protein H6807_12660 [Planctomycetes bacterium]|nr:hypothetical protein [Planctomycetota bacterium]